MGAPTKRVELTPEDLATLHLWEASGGTEQRLATRARVILAAVEGLSLKTIAEKTGLGYNSCLKWRKRFQALGLDGLKDAPGRGRHESISQEQRLEVMTLACTTPMDGSNAWSIRKIAEVTRLGVGTVHRILNVGDLKPRKGQHWCGKSPDPEFASKQAAIIGLYMNPPENALVLCVDEKSQIQHLDRMQPLLPMEAGPPKQVTTIDTRHGTTCLLAALVVHDGAVHSKCVDSPKRESFLSFIKHLYRAYPGCLLHVIADNLNAHEHRDVFEWVAQRRRLMLHSTPTYASWLNQMEIWFTIFSRDVVKDGLWRSKQVLIKQIIKYIKQYNIDRTRPFLWTCEGKPLRA